MSAAKKVSEVAPALKKIKLAGGLLNKVGDTHSINFDYGDLIVSCMHRVEYSLSTLRVTRPGMASGTVTAGRCGILRGECATAAAICTAQEHESTRAREHESTRA